MKRNGRHVRPVFKGRRGIEWRRELYSLRAMFVPVSEYALNYKGPFPMEIGRFEMVNGKIVRDDRVQM